MLLKRLCDGQPATDYFWPTDAASVRHPQRTCTDVCQRNAHLRMHVGHGTLNVEASVGIAMEQQVSSPR